jgi:transcription elongation factor Elf1
MVQRICPYCRCEDLCGQETNASCPSPYEEGPSPVDIYNACFDFYGHGRTVPDVDSWDLAQDLVRLGYLNSIPRLVDVEHAQELIREVER